MFQISPDAKLYLDTCKSYFFPKKLKDNLVLKLLVAKSFVVVLQVHCRLEMIFCGINQMRRQIVHS
jgi:hypothetical protein